MKNEKKKKTYMCQGLETQQHVSSPCCYCLFGGDLTC